MQNQSPEAKIVSVGEGESDVVLKECGERLRQGHLVAFPTETVYGLGCHALDPKAIDRVFEAKERPRTDPLIVHVSCSEDALALWHVPENEEKRILQTLMDAFWPGPLTLVVRAAPHVPSGLMANTGYVACRCPSHALARRLINVAKVPIAAPSANKFGHVSPTRAQHVWDDLQQEDVWIIQGDKNKNKNEDDDEGGSCCHVGVESTVAKVTYESGGRPTITLLRQGAISGRAMEESLQTKREDESSQGGEAIVVRSQTKASSPDNVATVAPGQTIRHYAPHVPSHMVSPHLFESSSSSLDLSSTVVVDWGGRLKKWKSSCLAYTDLSKEGRSNEAAQGLFDTLRWAERVPNAKRILFPQIEVKEHGDNNDPLVLALADRLTRAASGVVLEKEEEESSDSK